jgi:hypothetical protein
MKRAVLSRIALIASLFTTSHVYAENYTPLMHAAFENNAVETDTLLQQGANVNLQNEEGTTALMVAATENSLEAATVLLDSPNINLELKNKRGETALFRAARANSKEVAQLLIWKGANKEARHKYGRTPLLEAALMGHDAMFFLLAELGANQYAVDGDGRTAFDIAANGTKQGHRNICRKTRPQRTADRTALETDINNIDADLAKALALQMPGDLSDSNSSHSDDAASLSSSPDEVVAMPKRAKSYMPTHKKAAAASQKSKTLLNITTPTAE